MDNHNRINIELDARRETKDERKVINFKHKVLGVRFRESRSSIYSLLLTESGEINAKLLDFVREDAWSRRKATGGCGHFALAAF